MHASPVLLFQCPQLAATCLSALPILLRACCGFPIAVSLLFKPKWFSLQAVSAVRECLRNDTIAFVDETRFQRLLLPLVAQLGAQAPASIQLSISQSAHGTASDGSLSPAHSSQTTSSTEDFAGLLGDTLVQLANTGSGDVQWKALHRQARISDSLARVQTFAIPFYACLALKSWLQATAANCIIPHRLSAIV